MLLLLFAIVYLRTACPENIFGRKKSKKKGRDGERKEVRESGKVGGR